MYQILCDDLVLHDARINDLQVIGAKCDLEVNKTGALTFSIPPTHQHYDAIVKHKSIIKLLHNNEIVFIGRVLNDEIDFYNMKNVECEGELSYLLDSIQRQKEYHLNGGTSNVIRTYLQDLIDIHNNQVDGYKQFTLGEVTVADTNNYLYKISTYQNTLAVINEDLIDTYGGYILTRHADDITYIDYVSEYSGVCTQKIEFGKNIVDMMRYIKGEDVFTALIPLGAMLDIDITSEMTKRVTIKDLPNRTVGTIVKKDDYIYDSEAVKKWGWIWRVQTWDDVEVASNLLTKARELLKNSINETFTMELTAFDLSLLDVSIDSIKLGNKIQCVSPPHNIDQLMFVNSITIDLDNPANTKIKLCLSAGQKFTTSFTQTKQESDKIVDKIQTSLNEDYPTISEMDTKLDTMSDDLKSWVDDNYCAKDIDGNIDLSRYALINDVNTAFSELASALSEV